MIAVVVLLFYVHGKHLWSCRDGQLHGPSMFAVKAKTYGVISNQSSSIAFDENI